MRYRLMEGIIYELNVLEKRQEGCIPQRDTLFMPYHGERTHHPYFHDATHFNCSLRYVLGCEEGRGQRYVSVSGEEPCWA